MGIEQSSELVLARPNARYKEAVLQYREEFIQDNDAAGTGGLETATTFEQWLRALHDYEEEETVPKGRVPATEYLAIRASDGQLIGMLNIRHRLTDALQIEGGHIGYSVRKSERRKGYATEMLRHALCLCKELGISRVLLTCDKSNVASAKVINANGGLLQDETWSDDGRLIQRYWITQP